MSNIDLRRFVDIDIIAKNIIYNDATRDTAVLLVKGSSEKELLLAEHAVISSNDVPGANAANVQKRINIFFSNGGKKLLLKTYSSIESVKTWIKTNDEYVVICNVDASDDSSDAVALATYFQGQSDFYGIKEKIFVARTDKSSDYKKYSLIKNLAVKVSSYHGAELTIAAYLTNMNLDGINSVFDYCYTEEVKTFGPAAEDPSDASVVIFDAENITDEEFETIQSGNMNVDVVLSNSIRDVGGNLSNGADIVNTFVKIVLHQTLTATLLALLTEKIKDSTGTSKIYSTIVAELERYRMNGYLTTDKVWTKGDMNVTVNGQTFKVIDNNTPLNDGYYVKVLPLSALTEQDKATRSAPPIYVFIADQYGIRKITINGEVI